jgi:large subunit ribosomal protein L25
MSEVTLKAAPGREPGSRAAGRLRVVGQIPAVVYGHTISPVPVSVDWRELRAALTTEAGANALINLEVGTDTHLAVVRDMQRHPIRHDVLHIDFQVVSRDEIIAMDVPVTLTGENETIEKTDGATIEQQMHSITIKSTPGNIPNEISVDISGLEVGAAIRVSDLSLPAGVETDIDPDETVVSVMIVQIELPEPVEGEELPEGEEAAAAEGGEAPTAEAAAEGEAAPEGE